LPLVGPILDNNKFLLILYFMLKIVRGAVNINY
jgi:hypothetical protein